DGGNPEEDYVGAGKESGRRLHDRLDPGDDVGRRPAPEVVGTDQDDRHPGPQGGELAVVQAPQHVLGGVAGDPEVHRPVAGEPAPGRGPGRGPGEGDRVADEDRLRIGTAERARLVGQPLPPLRISTGGGLPRRNRYGTGSGRRCWRRGARRGGARRGAPGQGDGHDDGDDPPPPSEPQPLSPGRWRPARRSRCGRWNHWAPASPPEATASRRSPPWAHWAAPSA